MASRWHQPTPQFYTTGAYVWHTREILGHGATGTVYVGYEKKTGERVAVKMFIGGPGMKAVQREMDAVRHLPPHENIVKLIGVDEETRYRSQVIIMELCTNGSLFDVITAPENAYGLCETEFKQVIYDVAKGMQHLHKNNYIHKDIKPGNIMRCQKPDGSYTFKLADFGTARELNPEDDGFTSIDGTPEYLWPGMYERALINPSKSDEQFSAKIDLWSLGATFFHAATGRLPFQPYLKRKDRHQMFKIISEKPRGVVSGWQLVDGGPTIYDDKLPKDIRLSAGMAELTTEVLAGLMENDISKIWEFDQFFKQIERIQRKKVVDVFCVSTCTCHKIFIDPDDPDGLQRLKEGIQAQTDLPLDYQELFFANVPYTPTELVSGARLPVTTADRPMMVLGGNNKPGVELPMPPLPSVPSAPQSLSLERDLQYAKDCSRTIHYFGVQVEELERLHRLTHQAALCYCYTVRDECSALEQRLSTIDQLNKATCKVLKSQLARLSSLYEIVATLNQGTTGEYEADIQTLNDSMHQIENHLSKVRDDPDILQSKMRSIKEDLDSANHLWESKKEADVFSKSIETIDYMVSVVTKDFKTFQKEAARNKSLDALGQMLHRFTKTRLQGMLSEAQTNVGSLLSARTEVHTTLSSWLLKMIPVRFDLKEIGKHVDNHSIECNDILQDVDQWENENRSMLKTLNQKITASRQPQRSPKPDNDKIDIPLYLLNRFRESTHGLLSAVGQQKDLIDKLKIAPKETNSSQAKATKPSF